MAQDAPFGWSELAGWYDEMVQHGSGPHETAVQTLLELIPRPLSGTLLDLGCGQGLATRVLVAEGAKEVVAIDSAPEMIEIARARTPAQQPITWRVDDAQTLGSCPDASYDGVTAQLALMDIPDLEATLASVRRVLRPGGWFAFVISHPCFLAPDAATTLAEGRQGRHISRYFEREFWVSENPNGIRGRAGNHHRPISAYLNALIDAGFRLERALEPRASPLLSAQQPVYDNVPIFLGLRATAA